MDQQGCKLQRIADHLVQNSLLKGSMDNVTCVIIRINVYAARAINEALPLHLQQQIDAPSSTAGGSRRDSRSSTTQKYDAKAWSGAINDEESDLDTGLNGVSVYYPPGTIGGVASAVPVQADSHSVAQEEEVMKKQASKQLSRSRSTSRLTKGSSKRTPSDPYGTESDAGGSETQDSHQFLRRANKQQNVNNLNATITAGQSSENAYNRAGRDSAQQGQMPFPSSAYRSMHRPYTQASAGGTSVAGSSHLEAVGRTPTVQKALFVPSAYASQMSQGNAEGGSEGTSYSGGRSYSLFSGNNMAPIRDIGGGYTRPNTSNADASYNSGQRGYGSKRPAESYTNPRYLSDSSNRPNSAAPTLAHKVQGATNRFGGMSTHHEDQVRDFPPPHSPIITAARNRK